MSWVKCKECDAPVNSDDDPDCFVEVGNGRRTWDWITLCESCREQRELQDERDWYEQGLAEQEVERRSQ